MRVRCLLLHVHTHRAFLTFGNFIYYPLATIPVEGKGRVLTLACGAHLALDSSSYSIAAPSTLLQCNLHGIIDVIYIEAERFNKRIIRNALLDSYEQTGVPIGITILLAIEA